MSQTEREAYLSQALAYALTLTGEARDAYVQSVAQHDAGLGSELSRRLGERGGTLTIGSYKVIRQLGEGGMGSVYLAVRSDGTFQKAVALKVLKREAFNEDFLARFRQERQILASVDHPNICRIMDGGDTPEGLPYYVMDYVEGQDLQAYCGEKNLGLGARLRVMIQLCEAVQHLHDHRIVHRDLKPSNILVDGQGQVKLLDFGIAKQEVASQVELTGAQGRLLTPAYASPEQLAMKPVHAASDIYTLGVILYVLITDRLPDSFPPAAPSTRIQDGATRPETTQQLRKRVMGDLDIVVQKAMEMNPEARFRTAHDLALDLERFLNGEPVEASRPGPLRRLGKWVGRNQMAVAAATTVLVAAASGYAWLTYRQQAALDSKEAEIRRLLGEGPKGARADADFAGIASDVKSLRELLEKQFPEGKKLTGAAAEAQQAIVRKSQAFLDKLGNQAEASPALAREVSATYQRIAVMQDQPSALASYNSAALMLCRAAERNPEATDLRARIVELEAQVKALGGELPERVRSLLARAETAAPAAVAAPVAAPVAATPAPASTAGAKNEPAAPVAATPAPVVVTPAPSAPVVSSPALEEARERMRLTANRVRAAEQAFERMKEQLASQGLTIRPDTAAAMTRMKAFLDGAQTEIAAGRGEQAMEQLRAAEAMADRVGREVGR